jgi:hypothetical protein
MGLIPSNVQTPRSLFIVVSLCAIVLSTARIVAPLPGDRIPEFLSP